MKGRKPRPTNLKILEGNPGKRPLPQNEPKPRPISPKCPEHLSKKAKIEWRRIAPKLEKLGILTEIDGTALAAYCQTYARWQDAEESIAKTGQIIRTRDGNIIQNPFVGIANRALLIAHKYLTEFGMTPSSRTRLSIKPDEERSDIASYLT